MSIQYTGHVCDSKGVATYRLRTSGLDISLVGRVAVEEVLFHPLIFKIFFLLLPLETALGRLVRANLVRMSRDHCGLSNLLCS